jgi:hypothetical protein
MTFLRWVMVIAIVVVAAITWTAYRGKSDAEDKTAKVQQELSEVRRELSNAQIRVNEVKSQINDETERQARTAKAPNLVKEARIDWASAIVRLQAIAVPGIEPGPIVTQKEGLITTEGTAISVQAMEAYQAQLRRIGGNVRLVSLNWSAAEEVQQGVARTIVRYNAVLNVQKEAARS